MSATDPHAGAAIMPTRCGLCGELNDETSVPIGKFEVLYHKRCADQADLRLHIKAEQEKAARQAATVEERRRERAARRATEHGSQQADDR